MRRFLMGVLVGAAIGAAVLLPAALMLGCSGDDDDTPDASPEATLPSWETSTPGVTSTPTIYCTGGEDSDPDVEPDCCPLTETIPLADII